MKATALYREFSSRQELQLAAISAIAAEIEPDPQLCTWQEVLRDVVALAAAAHPGTRVWAAHRIGALAVGDSALEVAVAAAHRREAFEACADVVDRIKESVPIWKRERFQDGAHAWVGLDD